MTRSQQNYAAREAAAYTDPDAYASNLVLSSAFLPPDDPAAEPDAGTVEALRTLWHVLQDPFRDLLVSLSLSQTAASERFSVPLRTVQHWASGDRACPPYTRLMMAELTGLISTDAD